MKVLTREERNMLTLQYALLTLAITIPGEASILRDEIKAILDSEEDQNLKPPPVGN